MPKSIASTVAAGPSRRSYRKTRRSADDRGPLAYFPRAHQAVDDVGIISGKVCCDVGRFPFEPEHARVGGIGEGTGEPQAASLARAPRMDQMRLSKRRPTLEVLIGV